MDFNFIAGGEAGQGVQSVGFVLAKSMSRGGLYVFADQDYESRVRGDHNFFRVRVSDSEVQALSEKIDILIALNKETIELHQGKVKGHSITIFDQEKVKIDAEGPSFLNVPLERLVVETTSNKLMTNSVAMGAATGLVKYDFDLLATVLREQFAKTGTEPIENNVKAARVGYDYARQQAKGRAGVTLSFCQRGWQYMPTAGIYNLKFFRRG